MSPEERAGQTIRAMQDAFGSKESYHPCLADDLGDAFEDVRRFVAAAIREAVAAEREECANDKPKSLSALAGLTSAALDAEAKRAAEQERRECAALLEWVAARVIASPEERGAWGRALRSGARAIRGRGER